MKIIIDYESSWRNSFLEGNNNESLPKKGRKFVGSMTSLKKPENFIKREVTLNTVMGILNRLIGDQRKLYQSRNDANYFFKEIDFSETDKVLFNDNATETNEMTYIRNISGSTDQNSFTGAIKTNDAKFSSDYSEEFWGVLGLDVKEVCEFITSESFEVSAKVSLNPIVLVERIEFLAKEKNIDNEGMVTSVIEKLCNKFPELVTDKSPTPYIENSGSVKPIRLYSAALYLQLERLENKFDMESAVTKAGKVTGFSKRGFNGKRDFIKNFVTGGEKKIWGNPYIRKERIKGVGEVVSLMTKARGQLEIKLDISRDKAKEIRGMIEDAGVSSFYLGKKGLAYISQDIDIRELKQ